MNTTQALFFCGNHHHQPICKTTTWQMSRLRYFHLHLSCASLTSWLDLIFSSPDCISFPLETVLLVNKSTIYHFYASLDLPRWLGGNSGNGVMLQSVCHRVDPCCIPQGMMERKKCLCAEHQMHNKEPRVGIIIPVSSTGVLIIGLLWYGKCHLLSFF